jgi:S-adenosylmethionine-diacylglycerol 3-amino-3-carboxypropyl transferase
MNTEVASRVDFSSVRYAQCWEDADILLAALDIKPSHTCLSIASAGDNTLAMLAQGPAHVIALDLSGAQLACLELRVAAYRELDHDEMLRLLGVRPASDRWRLYRRCVGLLSADARCFWDRRPQAIESGIAGSGKLENYLKMFRTRALPLIHRHQTVEQMFDRKSRNARESFYAEVWDNNRWRWLFRTFCSRFIIGHFARDPRLFNYVDEDVSEHLLKRTRYALTALDPADNPYLQWMFFGHYRTALPYALRAENFDRIRSNLDRLEWRQESVEDFLESDSASSLDCFNLSDIFEYMSVENYARTLRLIVNAATCGARIAYWNMLVPRSRPEELARVVRPLRALSHELHRRDRAFFYRAFVLEEVL